MKNYFAVVVALSFIACGSSPQPEPVTPAPTDTEPTPVAGETAPAPDTGEGTPWADKTHEQKIAIMKNQVVPAVAAIWKESPEPEEEVNCVTCHGKSAEEGKFDMPNPALPALNPADGFKAHQDEAEWLTFMGTKLVPTMVQTLGVSPYDPATHEGFGCFACHAMAGK